MPVPAFPITRNLNRKSEVETETMTYKLATTQQS